MEHKKVHISGRDADKSSQRVRKHTSLRDAVKSIHEIRKHTSQAEMQARAVYGKKGPISG